MKQVQGLSLLEAIISVFILSFLLLASFKLQLKQKKHLNQIYQAYIVLITGMQTNGLSFKNSKAMLAKELKDKLYNFRIQSKSNDALDVAWTTPKPLYNLCKTTKGIQNCLRFYITKNTAD